MFGRGFDFDMYVMEKEGLTNTREGRLNAAIKEIETTGARTAMEVNTILHKYGLTKLEQNELVRVIKASKMQ